MTQTMKKLVPFLSVIVLMCSAAVALAQGTTSDDYPKVEVFAGYSALGEANSRGLSVGPTAGLTAITPPQADLKLRSPGILASISESRVTSQPISVMTQAVAPLPLALPPALRSRKTFNSRLVFTIFWQARNSRPATAVASHPWRMRWPAWRIRAPHLRFQHSLFF